MTDKKQHKIILYLKELRAPFCMASALAVIIGSAITYKQNGQIDIPLCLFAIFSTVCIHLGSNIANDYFDHLSGNDASNSNFLPPFSGGSQMIQNKLLGPKEVLSMSLFFMLIGAGLGIIILIKIKSFIVLLLGLAGILGGFFYTAPPLKLGYRGLGELTIAFLFGILPISGAYYIQAGNFSSALIFPVILVSIMIAMVLFGNEFPDFAADKAVNKKTIVVILGIQKAAYLYKLILIFICAIAVIFSICNLRIISSAVLLAPIFISSTICFKVASPEKLSQDGYFHLGKVTIGLHTTGCLGLLAAILI